MPLFPEARVGEEQDVVGEEKCGADYFVCDLFEGVSQNFTEKIGS